MVVYCTSDLQHVIHTGKVECLQREEVKGVVAISKHLCGAATGEDHIL